MNEGHLQIVLIKDIDEWIEMNWRYIQMNYWYLIFLQISSNDLKISINDEYKYKR